VAQGAVIDRLSRERERPATEHEPAAAAPSPAPAAPRPREPVRVVTVSAPSSRSRARDLDPARLVSVLDVDGSWADLTVDGHDVNVVAPTDDLTECLVSTVPARIVVNLAGPGALHALTTLRAAGSKARFWGCLADAASDRVLALGMLEPATKPLDPDAIVEILALRGAWDARRHCRRRRRRAHEPPPGPRAPRSLRLDGVGREAGRRLLQVVRPEVVVIDLGLPRRDGYGIVARLGTVDPVPSAVLLPGAEDTAVGFGPVLGDAAHADRMLTMKQYLAAVLAGSEEVPADRRQKVRAMGRK
jgi:hypothetical protein